MNYIQHNGPNQYGPRKGTLGLVFHQTEGNGGDGDLAYLLGDPKRGVSANFFSHNDGTVHQLMPIDQASGSMNPADRATADKGYYGSEHLKAVLGTHWTDPNAYSISIEIGGKRVDGPNPAQVASVIAWGNDMRARYPSLVGAFGHADQTDTKGCPGTTAAMKAIFAGIGGHGPFATGDTDMIPIGNVGPYSIALPTGIQLYDERFKPLVKVSVGQDALGFFGTGTGWYGLRIRTAGQDQLAFVKSNLVEATPLGASASYPVTVGGKPVGDVVLP